MAIVVVGGNSRGVGKTALVCGLIAALPEFRWTAVKIATHDHGHPEPIWEETEPGQGTGTARYLAAGAERALLATPPLRDRSPVRAFPPLLSALWPKLGLDANVLFESNRIVQYVKPDLCLIVHGGLDHGSRKASFSLAARHADAMVARADADRMLQGGEEAKPIFHLAALERISPEMQAWLRLMLRSNLRP
jgi:hypothetical protein